MVAYSQDLLQDAFYHLDMLKIKQTKVKLAYNRDRAIVNCMDELLKDCELIQLIIQSYDSHNFRYLCNLINHSFSNEYLFVLVSHLCFLHLKKIQ